MELGLKQKKIIAAFSVVLIFFIYIFWILLPQLDIKRALDEDIKQLKSNVEMNLVYKQKTASVYSEIKIINSKLNKIRKIYPPMINYDDLIICVKELAISAGVSMSEVRFGEYKTLDKKKTVQNPQVSDDGTKAINDKDAIKIAQELGFIENKNAAKAVNLKGDKIPNGNPYIFEVNFAIEGDNNQIKNFITSVYKLNNKVAIKGFSLLVSDKGEQVANINLELLGIMDMYAGEYSLLDDGTWNLLAPAKKEDLFLPYQGYNGGNVVTEGVANRGNQKRKETDDYNFILSVLPYGKGLTAPTIELFSQGIDDGGEGLPLKKFINADNPKVENVEIYLEEKNGGYYCKYRTQSEAFPDQGYTKLVKINPINDRFGLFVVSSKRSSRDDVSGVNVNVINKTKKEVSVKIKYDDTENPRVKVNDIEGSLKFQ